MKLHTHEEMLDRNFGVKGTPRRDKFERDIEDDLKAMETKERQRTKDAAARAVSKEEKRREWEAFLSRLKATPPEKLSKAARWAIENEGKSGIVRYDMRAVMK